MVNVFSFCLYGPENPLYYRGLLENIYLAGLHFPTWKVYVYYAPDVTEQMVAHLAACSSVVLIPTHVHGAPNMIHRFYAIDEPDVDIMMVRDADSRIHWKDRWAIRDFLAHPQFVAHTIRDHVEHTARIMGGLWGLRKSAGISMRTLYAQYKEDLTQGFRVAHDQNFLADEVYPRVLTRLLVHHGSGPKWMNETDVVDFPFQWSSHIFCGRRETDYREYPQPPPIQTPVRLVREFLVRR